MYLYEYTFFGRGIFICSTSEIPSRLNFCGQLSESGPTPSLFLNRLMPPYCFSGSNLGSTTVTHAKFIVYQNHSVYKTPQIG